MKPFIQFVLCMALVLSIAFNAHAEDTNKDEGVWIELFNGKDLEGWTPKINGYDLGDNFGNTFRVEDGLLKVGYEAYDEFNKRYGHLFWKDSYSHYRLRMEYRFVGDQCNGGEGWAFRNSGAMLHCQDPKSMDKDQEFPVSIEAQLLGGKSDGTERSTANLCTPGTNVEMKGKLFRPHCVNSSSKTYDGDQWVICEIEVRGDEVIRHFVNDELVLEYQKPQYDPKDKDAQKLIKDENNLLIKEGFISLQSESHPIEFKRVDLLVLE